MVREFDDRFLPTKAVDRGWQMFVIDEPDEIAFSIIDKHHVIFTWYRVPSLGEVFEKAEELLKEEVSI